MTEDKMFQEINLDIPSDKINDLEFIQQQFLNVAFDLCKKLSQYSEKPFEYFVNEFVPAQAGITDEFLETWELSREDLHLKNTATSVSQPDPDKPDLAMMAEEKTEETPINSTEEEPQIKVMIKKKKKKKRKIKVLP